MKHIIEKANEIYKKYGSDNLEFVAESLGAKIVEESLGGIIKEAYIKDLGIIVIDPNLHPYKKRHLIAHALAHHLFHRESKINYFKEQTNLLEDLKLKRQEKEAEVFAAYYLIPEEKLDLMLKAQWVQDSLNPISELAEEFQVSENFMRKRLEFKQKIIKVCRF